MTDQTAPMPKVSDDITLEEPIVRGDTSISTIKLRKPKSGELRGLSMVDIAKLEVDTLHKLLPRITLPTITEDEAKGLSTADLFTLSTEVALFLVPKALRSPET